MAKGAKASKAASKVTITKLSPSAYRGPLIDVHSQIDNKTRLDKVVPLLKKANVQHLILSWRGKRSGGDIVSIANNNSDLITASLRLKGRHFDGNTSKFNNQLSNGDQSGNFGAMAEALIFHAKKGKKAPKVVNAISSPQVSSALNVARKNGWPFVVHIEFAAARKSRKSYMESLEQLLVKHRDHPFALIHLGQLGVKDITKLIDAHPNIYFLTFHANTIAVNKSKQPWKNMFSGKKLSKPWKSLLIKRPERFVLAFDNVFAEHWKDLYVQQVRLWREALGDLPSPVAHAIAHKNAEMLWKLNPL